MPWINVFLLLLLFFDAHENAIICAPLPTFISKKPEHQIFANLISLKPPKPHNDIRTKCFQIAHNQFNLDIWQFHQSQNWYDDKWLIKRKQQLTYSEWETFKMLKSKAVANSNKTITHSLIKNGFFFPLECVVIFRWVINVIGFHKFYLFDGNVSSKNIPLELLFGKSLKAHSDEEKAEIRPSSC